MKTVKPRDSQKVSVKPVAPKKGTKRKSQPEASPPTSEEIEEATVVKKPKIETEKKRPVPRPAFKGAQKIAAAIDTEQKRPVPRPTFKGAQKLKTQQPTSSSAASSHSVKESRGLHKHPSDADADVDDDDDEPADNPKTPARRLKKAKVSRARDNEIKNKPKPLRRAGMATLTSRT